VTTYGWLIEDVRTGHGLATVLTKKDLPEQLRICQSLGHKCRVIKCRYNPERHTLTPIACGNRTLDGGKYER